MRNNGNNKTPHISPNTLIKNNDKYMNCWFRKNSLDDFYPMQIFDPSILYEFFEKNTNTKTEKK